ncbi:hypothetical protein SAMD00019534_111330 [Acytostelium subglobosum LB1]|uniref:hypothetical protein n=1 Tax=Acytostelium subglobosum LB1 TaxID=1410327 RepID=UPI000644B2B8|nr:hypothetical protein SAMD00019534_111330 [Acytostelium subglobosum LB1]GAM27957.1 hypothetical protein SAMD00019534_111330 [Acytostelium subglobosum LB1]|eukprot:XP_012749240.1 hypothetical protein SAMD00019534_111330 [Acytostelium subglobosum LB1]
MSTPKKMRESMSHVESKENAFSETKPSKYLNNLFKSHRKTTTALAMKESEHNISSPLSDITNSPPEKSTPALKSTTTTPIKSFDLSQPSPKTNRYTISMSTPTRPMNGVDSPNLMSPPMANGKSMFSNSASKQPQQQPQSQQQEQKKMKKRQLEKECQLMQSKIDIMEKIRNDNDSDIDRMKRTLLDTLTENDHLQRRVAQLEATVESMKSELNGISYDAWKSFCSVQDSPPGISTRYSKKRAITIGQSSK